ncbi:helix-turn-helix domain-containing protein [Flectobacillus major]|jgi:AraC-like DNA-binding protein|uniref:helix-turn-helix domain-containing protein n=1 Tax=Flectobacillus major TaxID=103 RepID=UPI0004061D74|nr:AraC family transcriptional regulator [Flectobacillus major]
MKSKYIHSITYEYLNRNAFLTQLTNELNTILTEKNTYTIDNSNGKGKFFSIEIEPGFEIELLQVQLYNDLHIRPIPANNNGKWSITICSNHTVHTDKLDYTQSHYPYCVIMSSSMAQQEIIIPAKKKNLSFSITFSKEWIAQNIIAYVKPEAAKLLKGILAEDRPVWQIDNIDIDLHRIISSLLNKDLYQNNTKLLFYRTALDLTLLFFEKLVNKSIFIPVQQFKRHDIQQIYKLNESILEDLSKPCPTIEELSKSIGMSSAKFKALYKTVFNTSVYTYHLNERLEQACRYLQAGVYTINEVAYMVGFHYPSSFSRIFKKKYGQSPHQFIKTSGKPKLP